MIYAKHVNGFVLPTVYVTIERNSIKAVHQDGSKHTVEYTAEDITRFLSQGLWRAIKQSEAESLLRRLIYLNGKAIEYDLNTVSIEGVTYDKAFLKQVVANMG